MSVSTSEQSKIPTACVGVLRLTKERQSIRSKRDDAIQSEEHSRARCPWEMHSSGQIRVRARRPSARIIVLESPLLTTAYEVMTKLLTPVLYQRRKTQFCINIFMEFGRRFRRESYIGSSVGYL